MRRNGRKWDSDFSPFIESLDQESSCTLCLSDEVQPIIVPPSSTIIFLHPIGDEKSSEVINFLNGYIPNENTFWFINKTFHESMNVKTVNKVTISSKGLVTDESSAVSANLGQYVYDQEKNYYKQSTTVLDSDPRYLYRSQSDGYWYVGDDIYKNEGYFKSVNKDDTLPLIGWQFWNDSTSSWQEDITLTITGARSQCIAYNVIGQGSVSEEWPSYFGQFVITNDWFNGRPVYKNTNGKVLCVDGSYGDWNIGEDYEDYNIWSVDLPMYPDRVKSWMFYDGTSEQPADISVICVREGNFIKVILKCIAVMNISLFQKIIIKKI